MRKFKAWAAALGGLAFLTSSLAWTANASASTGIMFERAFALVVGVDKYDSGAPSERKHAVSDAEKMRDFLIERGFSAEDITTLVSSNDEANRPTKARILAALDEILKRADYRACVVIYLAGDCWEADGYKSDLATFFLPSDGSQENLASSAIQTSEIIARLNADDAYAKYVFVDAGRKTANPDANPTDAEFAPNVVRLGANSVFAQACEPGGFAYEDEGVGGVFTARLIAELAEDQPVKEACERAAVATANGTFYSDGKSAQRPTIEFGEAGNSLGFPRRLESSQGTRDSKFVLSASRPRVTTVGIWGAPAEKPEFRLPTTPRRPRVAADGRALLIGAGPSSAANDAETFANLLPKFGFGETTTLVQSNDEANRPTKARILAAVDELTERSGPDSSVFVLLSGNGGATKDGVDLFCPSDVRGNGGLSETTLPVAEIAARLKADDARFKILFVDVPRTVLAEDVKVDAKDVASIPNGASGEKPGAFVWINACLQGERAYNTTDVPDVRAGKGVFTDAFSEAMKRYPFASFCEIYAQAARATHQEKHGQTPTLLFDGVDFWFDTLSAPNVDKKATGAESETASENSTTIEIKR